MHGCVHRHPCQPGVTPGSLVAALRPRHRVHFPWCLGAGRASSSRAESWAGGPPLPGRAAGGSVCAPRCPEAHGRQAGSACSRSQGWSCTLSIKCWTSGCSRKPVSVKGTLEETLEEMGLQPWHSLKGQCFRQRERQVQRPRGGRKRSHGRAVGEDALRGPQRPELARAEAAPPGEGAEWRRGVVGRGLYRGL